MLKYVNKISQVYWRIIANIINPMPDPRGPIMIAILFEWKAYYARYSFHDILDICEVSFAVAIIENLDCFSGG